LLLHGVGSNEEDLFGLIPAFDKRFLVISARAPITFGPGSYAWFEVMLRPGSPPMIKPEQAEASRKALLAFIPEAAAAYGADASFYPKLKLALKRSHTCAICSGVRERLSCRRWQERQVETPIEQRLRVSETLLRGVSVQ
jgi:hypothetical protein